MVCRPAIQNSRTQDSLRAPLLAALEWELNEKHTTHWSVADAEGNWVACTATINTSYGSKVVIPGTGVVLNNQMDDFSVQPGVANHFGLIGAKPTPSRPAKRPLSSMSPTIVLQDGKPIIAIGAAGGPKIIPPCSCNSSQWTSGKRRRKPWRCRASITNGHRTNDGGEITAR